MQQPCVTNVSGGGVDISGLGGIWHIFEMCILQTKDKKQHVQRPRPAVASGFTSALGKGHPRFCDGGIHAENNSETRRLQEDFSQDELFGFLCARKPLSAVTERKTQRHRSEENALLLHLFCSAELKRKTDFNKRN